MFLGKGFQAFISKPIEILRLDAVIKQWVRDKELEKTFACKQATAGSETLIDKRTGYDRRIFSEKINGLDMHKGLDRFGGDGDSYLEVLHSFATNTGPLIDALKKVNEPDGLDNLTGYAVTVHGIKGSSRGIGAGAVGDQAEALERAAKAGDFDFVAACTPAFIATVSKLVTDIEGLLQRNTQRNPKPKKDKPGRETLLKLHNE
jgi:HPt (histidine-containing phosphotransfer) domain-containing protein